MGYYSGTHQEQKLKTINLVFDRLGEMKKIHESKFLKIVSKILELKKIKSLNLKLEEISNWDSLKNLQLVLFLEDEFKIKFDEKELSSLISLKKIFKILKRKLNAKNQKSKRFN